MLRRISPPHRVRGDDRPQRTAGIRRHHVIRHHPLSFPRLPGVSAWGSYSKISWGVRVSVCAQDTSHANFAVAADVESLNASRTSSSEVGAVSLGYHQTVCRSMTLHYTSHLRVSEFTVNSKGQVAKRSTIRNIY